jgi:hypothetical protein
LETPAILCPQQAVKCNVIINKNRQEVECGREFEYHGNTTGIWYHLNAEHDITRDRVIKKQVSLLKHT